MIGNPVPGASVLDLSRSFGTSGLAHAGTWAVLSRLLAMAGRVIRNLVLASLLAPADVGLAALAVIAIETLQSCTSPGLEPALIQRDRAEAEDVDSVFAIQLIRGISLGAIVWVAAPLVAQWVAEPRVQPVMRWLAPVPALSGLVNPGTVHLTRTLRFRRLFVWEFAEISVALGVGLAVAFRRADVTALIAAMIAGQSTRTALSWILVPDRATPRLSWSRAVRLLRFGRWVLAGNILMLLGVQGEHALVGAVLGVTALGINQIAGRIAGLPVVLLAYPAVQVALPALAPLRDERAALARRFRRLAVVLLSCCGVWLAIVTPAAPRLIQVLFGDAWIDAVPILRIAAATTFFRAFVVLGQPLFYAVGRPHLHVVVHVLRLVAIGALLIPIAGHLTLPGVATTVLEGTAAAAVFQLWLVRRVLGRRRQ